MTNLKITDGTSQNNRFPVALKENYFNVDEMGMESLLSMSTDFARLLSFYNLQNQKDGTWNDLFTDDDLVIMAIILSTDLRPVELEFLEVFEQDFDETSTSYDLLTTHIYQLALKIDFWFKQLSKSESESTKTLSQKIGNLIEEKLSTALHSLGQFRSSLKETDNDSLLLSFKEFSRVWRIEIDEENSPVFPNTCLPDLNNRSQRKKFLRANYYSFHNAIVFIKKISQVGFEDSFKSKAHNPAIGLFITFLKLFQQAQNKVNKFTERHLDFYFFDILKTLPKKHVLDSAYLIFKSGVENRKVFVEKGTTFTANIGDKKSEIIFEAENDLLVTDVEVNSLYTLNFDRNKLVSPEKELNFVSRIQLQKLSCDKDEDVAWPIFGAAKEEGRQVVAQEGEIGFAVASPVLFLKEGQRTISLIIEYSDSPNTLHGDKIALINSLKEATGEESFYRCFGDLFRDYLLAGENWLRDSYITDILQKAEKTVSAMSLGVIRELLEFDRRDLLYKIFNKLFKISLTTEHGWFEISDYLLAPESNDQSDSLRIEFTLNAETASIVAYDHEVHGSRFATDLPLLKILVNQESYLNSFSILKNILLNKIVLDTEVKGAKSLLAYNNYGQLDPSGPFNPFGPIPTDNSYFIVGNYETAKKNLSEFTLNIEWGDLPKKNGGFREYYQGYEMPFNNKLFRVNISCLQNGSWQPQQTDERSEVSLFSSQTCDQRIAEDNRLKTTNLHFFKPIGNALPEDNFKFDLKAKNGFFKYSLVQPNYAFGHKAYPPLLTKILSENVKKKKPRSIPSPPYTPLINKISIDYQARSVIKVGQELSSQDNSFSEKVFHIHPLGAEEIYPTGNKSANHLLPQIDQRDGNLLIGLTGKQIAGIITLFFHMGEDSVQGSSAIQPQISWHYLTSNQWKEIEKSQIISDTTNGFLASGFVTLNIPSDINLKNTIMPTDRYWLKASADKNLTSFASLYSVKTQVLKVNRRGQIDDLIDLTEKLPAGSITKAVFPIQGVGGFYHKGTSFGGRSSENRTQLKTRISERLRHKNRATLPWDYERLILENFPHIYKVKCFSNMSTKNERELHPGHILIAVIPYKKEGTSENNFTPMVNAVDLNEIRDFIKKLASPFAEIEVRNPVYERIQIRCTVRFTHSAKSGFYINKLNQAIIDYLSPWEEHGYMVRFGWCIQQVDIESYIRDLNYVDFVTDFSMLHIIEDEKQKFTLEDTVSRRRGGGEDAICSEQEPSENTIFSKEIYPRYPWSIAIPVRDHFINTTDQIIGIEPEVTGIDELEIGNTFIISG